MHVCFAMHGISQGVKEINRMNVERQKRDDARALKWPGCTDPTNSCHGSLGYLIPCFCFGDFFPLVTSTTRDHERAGQAFGKVCTGARRRGRNQDQSLRTKASSAFGQVVLSSPTNCAYGMSFHEFSMFFQFAVWFFETFKNWCFKTLRRICHGAGLVDQCLRGTQGWPSSRC